MIETRILIDEMKTAVVRDGRHAYYEVGGDINIRDEADNLLKPVSLTAVAADKIADKCDVKTSGTKYKCGYSTKDLGIKDRTTGKTIVVEPYRIVGLIIDKDKITHETIETANTTGKSLSSDNAVSLFKYCTLKYVPINSGVAVRHFYKKELAKDFPQYKYYGMLWRCGDKDVLKHIEGDDSVHHTDMMPVDGGFIEYFSVDCFHDQNPETGVCDGPLHDVVHNYSTVGGTLGANTEYTAGTYYVTSTINTAAYTLTLNCAAGDIVIKPNTALSVTTIIINIGTANGKVLTSNTGTYKVIFTSMNDDAKGETIAGSSGSPATDDIHGRVIGINVDNATLACDNVEIWYSAGALGIIAYSLNGATSSSPMTLSRITFKYCTINNTYNYLKAYIGQYRYATAIGAMTLSGIDIDNTNALAHTGYASCIQTNTGGCPSFSLTNSYFDTVNTESLSVLYLRGLPDGATIKSVYIKLDGACSSASVAYLRAMASTNMTINVSNCIIDGVSNAETKSNYYFYAGGSAYTMTVNMLNCISMNSGNANGSIDFANGVGTYAGSVNKCVYYNNTADFDSAHGTTNDNPITADPQLSTAPAGSTVLSTSPFSGKSVVVTNLAALEKQGSDTFDNLSWDEAVYSATGYGYTGTDKVTPGLMIEWSAFVPGGGSSSSSNSSSSQSGASSSTEASTSSSSQSSSSPSSSSSGSSESSSSESASSSSSSPSSSSPSSSQSSGSSSSSSKSSSSSNSSSSQSESSASSSSSSSTEASTSSSSQSTDSSSSSSEDADEIAFTDAGSNTVYIPFPLYGYESTITMGMRVSEKLSTGLYRIYDRGVAYDIRTCRAMFLLNRANAEQLHDLYKDADKSRAYSLTMVLPSGSGFFPFGPDKGDAGSFQVRIIGLEHYGTSDQPRGWFRTEITMVAESYPVYSVEDAVADGPIQIGTITGLRWPDSGVQPAYDYAVSTVTTQDGSPYTIDKWSNADAYETSLNLSLNDRGAQRLINHLTGTVRGAQFNILSINNGYMFGIDLTTTGYYYVCRLTDNELRIRHNGINDFAVTITASLEDTTAV
jgi:hypothetical protein